MANQNGKENIAPAEKVRFGGITASIYANDVVDMPIPLYKLTFSRSYAVKGEVKTVTSFRHEDLPSLVHVTHEAWVRIEQLKQQAWAAARAEKKETSHSGVDEEQ